MRESGKPLFLVGVLLLHSFFFAEARVCNSTTNINNGTDVYNMITHQAQEDIWIEGGFIRAGDTEWVSVSTILKTFKSAVVFVSLPEIDGETSSEGYPAIARVRNVVGSGRASFDVRLFQANDSYCLKNWSVPKPIRPPLGLSWIVVERGAFNLSGSIFMIGEGEITRAVAAPYDPSNRHTFMFPSGCVSPGVPCEYPEGSDVGIIIQLQTTVNERILISRVYSSNGIDKNNSVTLVLQTHDSPYPEYYEVHNPEHLAFLTYMNNIEVSCVERLSFETLKHEGVTHFKKDVTFLGSFTLPPGIYGTIATARSLADSTGLRAFDRTVTGASFITQEDQCFDEETKHTTGELVYTFVVGEREENGCTVCKAVFTPDTAEPTSAPTTVCQENIQVIRMSRG